ncbi:hypothetical protein K9B35_00665 [Sphingomonas sp. R647]|nr:hypothetical protein [Sphingomonas sp. R647]
MSCAWEDLCCTLAGAAAARFDATVVLKSSCTWIAMSGQPSLLYNERSSRLASAGSVDFLAGAVGGLLARNVPAYEAAAWGVWLHGETGRKLAGDVGVVGFLAREVLPPVSSLLSYE